MKYFILLAMMISIISLSCSASKQFTVEKPQAGKCLLIGAVLLENNGIEDKYETKFEDITVVIAGKFIENGEEETEGYRVKTDENGYFMMQNVPVGSYVIKGFEADIGFQTRIFVTSRWDGSAQIYYPTQNLIDFTVRDWPEIQDGKITNLKINYFMIDQANRVAHERFDFLQDKPGTFPDTKYTLLNPLNYYKSKFPAWEWFKEY